MSLTYSEIKFSLNILKILNIDNDPNAFSLMSILNNLALIYSGFDDLTAVDQIFKVIWDGKQKKDVIEQYANLMKYYRRLKENNGTNHIYSKNLFLCDTPLLSSYTEIMQEFDTEYQQLDFGSNSIESINQLISNNTNNQISNILTENDDVIITNETHFLNINALHVHPEWDNNFAGIGPGLFFVAPFTHYSCRKTKLLYRQIEYEAWNFTEGETWKCLGIPYKHRKSWLHILLPNKRGDLNELINKMDFDLLKQCIAKNNAGKMNVWIPVFEIGNKVSLKQVLSKLGMSDIFNGEDIHNIFNPPRHVDNILNQTKINVDLIGYKTPPHPEFTEDESGFIKDEYIKEFCATHPFVYFVSLVDDDVEDLKSIVLMGKYV